jgi:hypothetical protein
MKRTKKLRKNPDQSVKEIFEIEEKNRPLTLLLKNKTGFQKLEDYPQEVDYYLTPSQERKKKLEAEKEKVRKKISGSTGEKLARKLRRKNDLELRIKELEKEKEKNIIPKYLSYVTNNERL